MDGPREDRNKSKFDRELIRGYASDPVAAVEHYRQTGLDAPRAAEEAVRRLRDFSKENKL